MDRKLPNLLVLLSLVALAASDPKGLHVKHHRTAMGIIAQDCQEAGVPCDPPHFECCTGLECIDDICVSEGGGECSNHLEPCDPPHTVCCEGFQCISDVCVGGDVCMDESESCDPPFLPCCQGLKCNDNDVCEKESISVCHYIAPNETCQPICVENALVVGCYCKPGYLPPGCCECDTGFCRTADGTCQAVGCKRTGQSCDPNDCHSNCCPGLGCIGGFCVDENACKAI